MGFNLKVSLGLQIVPFLHKHLPRITDAVMESSACVCVCVCIPEVEKSKHPAAALEASNQMLLFPLEFPLVRGAACFDGSSSEHKQPSGVASGASL